MVLVCGEDDAPGTVKTVVKEEGEKAEHRRQRRRKNLLARSDESDDGRRKVDAASAETAMKCSDMENSTNSNCSGADLAGC